MCYSPRANRPFTRVRRRPPFRGRRLGCCHSGVAGEGVPPPCRDRHAATRGGAWRGGSQEVVRTREGGGGRGGEARKSGEQHGSCWEAGAGACECEHVGVCLYLCVHVLAVNAHDCIPRILVIACLMKHKVHVPSHAVDHTTCSRVT